MSLTSWLYGGYSMVSDTAFKYRLANKIGRLKANRHKNVFLSKSCIISPDAFVHPRNGKITIGEKSSIALGSLVQGNVALGNNCSIQAYCNITGYENGEIKIGDNVRIASHTIIIAANHNFSNTEIPIYKQGIAPTPITIEEDVWIGSRVNILAGVTIGRGSVIGAGAVVTHDIPPYSVAVGVPAKIISNRRKENKNES